MDGSTQTLELYIRSLAAQENRARQTAVLERLKTLAIEDKIGGYSVYVCGTYLPANPEDTNTEFGRFLHNRIGTFQLWAAQNDISMETLFERRELDSSITGESRADIVVPTMVLAEYEGSTLQFVSPCETGDGYWHVTDRLKRLDDETQSNVEPLQDAYTEPPGAASSRDADVDPGVATGRDSDSILRPE